MSDHLTAEEFFEFVDQGGGSGPVGRHLMSCQECLFELDFLLLAEGPATPAEEAALDAIPDVTAEDLLARCLAVWSRLGVGILISPDSYPWE